MADDRILLTGMVFFGFHGTIAAERDLGQHFVVDIDLDVDLADAGRADDLSLTVDYGDVYRQAKAIVEGPPAALTETVAERIATAVLQRHERVQSVRIRVTKPEVRLDGGVLHGSSVEIVRRRSPSPLT